MLSLQTSVCSILNFYPHLNESFNDSFVEPEDDISRPEELKRGSLMSMFGSIIVVVKRALGCATFSSLIRETNLLALLPCNCSVCVVV